MKELNLKHEAKRYGCAVLAATIMALNIKTFVRAGGLFPGGFTGLTLLLQNIFQTFMGIAVPYTLINVLLNSIPVFIGLKFIGKKFTISSVCVTSSTFKTCRRMIGKFENLLINLIRLLRDNKQRMLLISLMQHLNHLSRGKLKDNRVKCPVPSKK